MKKWMKARQKVRKQKVKVRLERKTNKSVDKAFAAALISSSNKRHSHMEWNGSDFIPTKPEPSPKLSVKATIMHTAHKKLGVDWKGSRLGCYSPKNIDSIADTGCQTCTGGEDILANLKCPSTYLVPTSHRIMGINASNLGLVGAVMLRLEYAGKVTRQMVHISKNVRGLYLSKAACRELGLIENNFPHVIESIGLAAATSENGPCQGDCTSNDNSQCPIRTETPLRPSTIPFKPVPENREKLQKWLLEAFSSSAFNTCSYQELPAMSGEPMQIKIKPNAPLSSVKYKPIPVPFHFKKAAKRDIDRDVRMGVLQKKPQGEATLYCSQTVFTPKSNWEPRRTIDFKDLNEAT